ncbi:MAG: cobalamin B12-binding domain-containing protein [Candidatus Brocadiae bacterium]|nr:cobalamin B12-binding domain-containing protein [Candidatus Brocadiia bacterium]
MPSPQLRVRLIYPRFRKFLEGHARLQPLIQKHQVGNYTMPPPLGLPLLAALTPPDVEVQLTDDNIGQPIDWDEEVDAVAISFFTPQAARAYEIADAFRARGVRVILGGIHPTCCPEEALGHADAVCVGEGEPVWGEILSDLRAGTLRSIYRPTGEYDLAQMPVPRREIFAGKEYSWSAHLVLVTRGCPVRCTGCPIPLKEGLDIRYRPVEKVIEDIESMPYKQFYIIDDTVMLPNKRRIQKYLLSLMERTAGRGLSIFLASTMMMDPDPEFYRKLKAGGTSSMYTVFGFDRLSRRLMSADCTAAEWQAGIDLVRMNEDAGIHFFGSFGIGTEDQDPGVFDRILQFTDEARIDLAEFYIETPFPGTPFGMELEKQGRILHRNYDLWNTGNVVFKPKNFTEDELLQGFLSLWEQFYDGKDENRTLRTFEGVASRPV